MAQSPLVVDFFLASAAGTGTVLTVLNTTLCR